MESKKDKEELENWKRKKEEKEIEKYGVTLEELCKYDIKQLDKISKVLKKILISIWIIALILFSSSILVTLKFLFGLYGKL